MYTTVRAKVFQDNTGMMMEIPVIITECGVLRPLLGYFLETAHTRSFSWMQKTIQAVGLLLDYMAANHDRFEDPKELFRLFVQRLYIGTIGEDGTDPSGLYWLPKSTSVVNLLAGQLSAFSGWMATNLGASPLNPWREATSYEGMLQWAAYHHRYSQSFLSHTWDIKKASLTAKQARNTVLRRAPKREDHDEAKYFPEEHIADLLFKGFIVPGKQKSRRIEERLNLRDILITILMHYGGVRASEPFHLYVHDVQPDPLHPGRAMVRIYHPSEGLAPNDWLDAKGKRIKCNREAYLRGKYGMRPRDQYFSTDQLHAGWKGNLLESTQNYMHVHWFPTWSGELFLKLWNVFIIQRALKDCNHPFAFVTGAGNPYSLDTFMTNHARAVKRIGLEPSKILGTTPHGHRHAYGQRMVVADIDPSIRKKALHHKSLTSQAVYSEMKQTSVSAIFDRATRTLAEGKTSSIAEPDLLMYGFEDVDPFGLLSGQRPKLLRNNKWPA